MPAKLRAQGHPDFEVTTDAGEKFHLVHIQGSNYDIYTEADDKKIGSIDMRTNNPVVIGPDYAANGAAMQRGVAASKEPGHMVVYQGPPSAPQPMPSAGAIQPQQSSEPVSASVVAIDAAKGEATIMPTPQTITRGPIKISHGGNKIETEIFAPNQFTNSNTTIPFTIEYQGNAVMAAAGSLGRDILQFGQGRREMAGANSLRVVLGKDSSFADHQVTVIKSDGSVADDSLVGGKRGGSLLQTVKTAAPELIGALKAYGQATGTGSPVLPILYKVAGIAPNAGTTRQ
jgi:hypothetical protein